MANEISIKISADNKQALRAFSEVMQSAGRLSNAFKGTQTTGFGDMATQTRAVATAFKEMKTAAGASASAVVHLKTATVNASKEEIDAKKKSARVFSDAMKAASAEARHSYSDQVKAARAAAADQKRAMSEAANAQKRFYAEMTQAAKKSADQQASAFSKVRGVIGGVGKVALGGAVGAGVLGIGAGIAAAKGIIETTAAFEGLNARMLTVLGTQGEVNLKMAELSDFARKTPYELSEVVDAFVRMRSYGLDPTAEKLRLIGDFAASMGRTFTDAVEAVADATRVGGAEFERIREMGITKEAVAAMGKNLVNAKGEIQDYAKFQEALFQLMGERSAGAMARMSDTIIGRWSNLKDALARASIQIGEGLKGPIKMALEAITKAIEAIVTPETTQRISDFFERTFSPDNMRDFARAAARAGLEMKAMFDDWYNLLKTIMDTIKEMKGIPTQATASGAGTPGLFDAPKLDWRGRPRIPKGTGPGSLPPADFGALADQFALNVVPRPGPRTEGQRFYDDLKGGAYQSPTRNLSSFPPPPKMNPLTNANAEEEARKRKEREEMARILATKDPFQRDLKLLRKEFREKKTDLGTSSIRDVEVEEARKVQELYKKYKDDRAKAEEESIQRYEELNKSVEEFEKKRLDLTKEIAKNAEETNQKEYERMEAKRQMMLEDTKNAQDRQRIEAAMADAARAEADRVKDKDPDRRIALLAEAAEHDRNIAQIKKEQFELLQRIGDQERENATARAINTQDNDAIANALFQQVVALNQQQAALKNNLQNKEQILALDDQILQANGALSDHLQQQFDRLERIRQSEEGIALSQAENAVQQANSEAALATSEDRLLGVIRQQISLYESRNVSLGLAFEDSEKLLDNQAKLNSLQERENQILQERANRYQQRVDVRNDIAEQVRRSTMSRAEQRRLEMRDQISGQMYGKPFSQLQMFGPEQADVENMVKKAFSEEARNKVRDFWRGVAEDGKRSLRGAAVGLFEGLYSGQGNALKQFGQAVKAMLIRAAAESTVQGISGLLKGGISGIFGGGQKKQTDPAAQTAQLLQPVKEASSGIAGALQGLIGVFAFGKNRIASSITILAQVIASIKGGGGGGGGGIFGWISDALGAAGDWIDDRLGTGFFGDAGRTLGQLPNLATGGILGGTPPLVKASSAMRMEMPSFKAPQLAFAGPSIPRLSMPSYQQPRMPSFDEGAGRQGRGGEWRQRRR